MDEPTTTVQTENTAAAVETQPAENAGAAETQQTETAQQELSRRDAFRKRVSERYPDLNMDDEDAYYEQMGKAMDDYEGYEKNTERLRDAMKKSPEMVRMLNAAQGQENFDPIAYMFENASGDILALAQDPEGAKKFGEMRAEQLAKQAEGEAIQTAITENMPKSVEAIKAKAQEIGVSDEQASEIVGKMFQVMDDLVHGKIDPEIFVMMAKGSNYDNAVEQAHEEGRVEGVNTKVNDKLRTLENKKEHVAGVQTPMKTPEPKKRERNMFLANDEDYDY